MGVLMDKHERKMADAKKKLSALDPRVRKSLESLLKHMQARRKGISPASLNDARAADFRHPTSD